MRIGILLLAAGRKAGGPETYEVELIRGLALLEREKQFFVYTTEDGAEAEIGVRQSNFHYRLLKPRNRVMALTFGIHLQMRRDRIDLLHCTYAPPPFASGYVFTMHCVSNLEHAEYYGRAKGIRLNLLQRRGLLRAKEILCVSSFVSHELNASYGVPLKKTSIVYNGVGESFKPAHAPGSTDLLRSRYGISKPYILYVGKLQARKNITRLVKAFNLFREWSSREDRGGADLQLVLAGSRSEPGAGFGEAIGNSPYRADILEIGYIESPSTGPNSHLPTLYRHARMFVFPSLFEGFGIPLIEAMACGTPVLASNVTSLPEVAGDAALLVDPLSVHEIALGISRLHNDEELRRQLIQRGFARARRFTWEQCAQQTLAAYNRALS